jgi:hypothetical protein
MGGTRLGSIHGIIDDALARERRVGIVVKVTQALS